MHLLHEIEGYFSHRLAALQSFYTLIKLESKLAVLSLLPALISVVCLVVVLPSLWLSISVLLAYGIFYYSGQLWIAIVSVSLLNLVLCMGLIKFLLYNFKNMSFERTREYLQASRSQALEVHHASNKTTYRRSR